MQQESNRLEGQRKEIDMAKKELNSDIKSSEKKRKKKQRETKHMGRKKADYENNAAT